MRQAKGGDSGQVEVAKEEGPTKRVSQGGTLAQGELDQRVKDLTGHMARLG